MTDRYQAVAEANRRMYAGESTARDYARTTLVDDADLAVLNRCLDKALMIVGNPAHAVRALDCCGGPGTVAIPLLERGCETTLVDISPEMIDVFRAECGRRRYSAATHCSEIADFLQRCEPVFDLVVFSSALHHLEDPALVLNLAQRALGPRGVILTMFDPIRQRRGARLIIEPARMLDRAMRKPSLLWTRAGAVIRRVLAGESAAKGAGDAIMLTDDNVGYLAEFHGDTGIDDAALIDSIRRAGRLRVVEHERTSNHCGPLQHLVRRGLGVRTHFSLLLQNP